MKIKRYKQGEISIWIVKNKNDKKYYVADSYWKARLGMFSPSLELMFDQASRIAMFYGLDPLETTFRDLLKKEHPEKVDSAYIGGCFGCPHTYGYAPTILCSKKFESLQLLNSVICRREDVCRACWKQKIV